DAPSPPDNVRHGGAAYTELLLAGAPACRSRGRRPPDDPRRHAARRPDDPRPRPRPRPLRAAAEPVCGHAGRAAPRRLRPATVLRDADLSARRPAGGLRPLLLHLLDVPGAADALP